MADAERSIAVYVPKWLYERIREEASRRGLSMSSLVRELLMKHFGGEG